MRPNTKPMRALSDALQLGELGRHGRVAARELLDRHVLRLVVGQPQVAVGAQQRLLGLLQVVDRLVDLVDRGLEAPRGQVVVLGERRLEGSSSFSKFVMSMFCAFTSASSDLYFSAFIAALRSSVMMG
jgi:hypothetical protein